MSTLQLQEGWQLRFRDHQEMSARILSIMNCFLQEKQQCEEEAARDRQRLLEQHDQAIGRKNTTIEQLSATVETLSTVLRGCREQLLQVRATLQCKGRALEELRRSSQAEILSLKEKLLSPDRAGALLLSNWQTQPREPAANCQDQLKNTPLKKPEMFNRSHTWAQEGIMEPSHRIVLEEMMNRLASHGSSDMTSARTTCSNTTNLKEQACVRVPSYQSRPPLEGFAVGKENTINKPFVSSSKLRKNTTFLKRRDTIKELQLKEQEGSFGITHNRSISQLHARSKGTLRQLKRLSQVMH